ncbi:hypothetical protein TNCV_2263221 [Trichonephila clavipes]|nr:hypothetical protein TNCV_2263221 [Trichonephila clavipes]
MSHVRSRNAYQHVSHFDKGQIVAYRYCGLSYHSIAARIGQDRSNDCQQNMESMGSGHTMDSQFGDHGFAYLSRCITDRSVFSGVINEELGCTLNRARYIPGTLQTVVLPSILALQNPTFQQVNAGPHVAGIVGTSLDMENVLLLDWPARSLDLCNRNVWSMVAE